MQVESCLKKVTVTFVKQGSCGKRGFAGIFRDLLEAFRDLSRILRDLSGIFRDLSETF